MLTCPNPTCAKKLESLERECPRCRTDLSLLVDYVENLDVGLVRAEALTRAGQLGEAVWAYLEVLEVDPDNATARGQVGQVCAAVRQFDRAALGRRWLARIQSHARFRQWADSWGTEGDAPRWLVHLLWLVLVLAALGLGGVLGYSVGQPPPPAPTPAEAPP